MASFELNLAEGLNSEEQKNKINYKIFPIKKRILMAWKKETMEDDLGQEKEEPETKSFLLSLPPKKRFSGMKRDREVGCDDVCDHALAGKRQRVETTVCFKPETPPIEEFSIQKRQKAKTRVFNKSKSRLKKKTAAGSSRRPRIKKSCRSFVPKTTLASGSSIDASKLLPDYVKNHPEFQGMTEVKLVIEKSLEVADLLLGQDRLSIPYKQIKSKFLSDSEFNLLKTRMGRNRKYVLPVKVMGPCSDNIHKMKLKRWDYKGSGYRFAITSDWNYFRAENGLKLNDFIQVISFRVNGQCCFVILKPEDVSLSSSAATWGLKGKRTRRNIL